MLSIKDGSFINKACCSIKNGFKSKGIAGESRAGFVFIVPALIVISIFIFIPLFWVLYLSFTDTTFFNYPGEFIGLKNFVDLITWDTSWWISFKNTLIMAGANLPVGIVLALLSALILNEKLAGRTFFRWGFLVPVSSSAVAVALMWLLLYEPSNGGILNYIFRTLGIIDKPVAWLGNYNTALPAVIFTMFGRFGFRMLIYLSALQGIPEELYEAADIDGASKWRQFTYVTWPQLMPATFFILINNLASSLRMGFQEVFVLTGGGPMEATRVISLAIYESAFVYGELGYTCAMALIVLVITAIITLLIGRKFNSRSY